MVKLVRFNIFRKFAFAGALWTYKVHINGKFVGNLNNGKTLNVEVPEADIYYLEGNYIFEINAIIINRNTSDYKILIKTVGGWRTNAYQEFYIDNGDTIDQLPSFDFARFLNAVFNYSIDQLYSGEQLFALCYRIMDHIQEVLESSNLSNTLEALKTISANRHVDLPMSISKLCRFFWRMRKQSKCITVLTKANQLILKINGPHTTRFEKLWHDILQKSSIIPITY